MILALRWAASSLVWVSSTSSICRPQVITGLSAVIGSWKIIDHARAAQFAQSGLSGRQHVLALEQDLARGRLQGLGQEAMDGEGDHRLARTGFATRQDDLGRD